MLHVFEIEVKNMVISLSFIGGMLYLGDLIKEHLSISELPIPKTHHHNRCIMQYFKSTVI